MSIDEIFGRARWQPGRCVRIDDDLAALHSENYAVWPALEDFLREFAGLNLRHDGSILSLGSVKAVKGSDPDFGRAYERYVGSRMSPVGLYAGMVLYLTPDGRFFGAFDELLGQMDDDIRSIASEILIGPPGEPFTAVPEIEAWSAQPSSLPDVEHVSDLVDESRRGRWMAKAWGLRRRIPGG